jgi:butyrate kinase
MNKGVCGSEVILVINPGATSTKFAVYEGENVRLKKTVEHSAQDTGRFCKIADQHQYRLELVLDEMGKAGINPQQLTAVVARGGLLKPLKGGTYRINKKMVEDLSQALRGEHASNLGAIIAFELENKLGIPSFIVDPVSVDEMEPEARLSGLPDLERVSLSHALNMKAVARKVAKEMGKKYEEVNFVVAHLGTGISVTPHRQGRMVDVNNAKEEGPFSPDRCGGVPAGQLVKLCFSGKYTFEQLKEKFSTKGGLYAYMGTTDIREVTGMADSGDDRAALILDAMAYQVVKEIGAMAAVLAGEVHRVILTGGIAYSERIVSYIRERVSFIAPVEVIPGEEELEALAFGALRVLRKEEPAQTYI